MIFFYRISELMLPARLLLKLPCLFFVSKGVFEIFLFFFFFSKCGVYFVIVCSSSHSFDVSGRLCSVIVVLPVYISFILLDTYLYTIKVLFVSNCRTSLV